MRHLDLGHIIDTGASLGKQDILKNLLEITCTTIRGDTIFSPEVKENACQSIWALKSITTAKNVPKWEKIYRYFYKERLRALLAAAFERTLPFNFNFTWSARRLKEVLTTCRMTFFNLPLSMSRILRNQQVCAVGSIIETLVNDRESIEMAWWFKRENVSHVIVLAINYGFTGSIEASEEEKEEIQNAIHLFTLRVGFMQKCTKRTSLSDAKEMLSIVRKKALLRSENPCSTTESILSPGYFYLSIKYLRKASSLVKKTIPIYYVDWMCKAEVAEERMKEGASDPDNVDNLYWVVTGRKRSLDTRENLCYADTLLKILRSWLRVLRKLRDGYGKIQLDR